MNNSNRLRDVSFPCAPEDPLGIRMFQLADLQELMSIHREEVECIFGYMDNQGFRGTRFFNPIEQLYRDANHDHFMRWCDMLDRLDGFVDGVRPYPLHQLMRWSEFAYS